MVLFIMETEYKEGALIGLKHSYNCCIWKQVQDAVKEMAFLEVYDAYRSVLHSRTDVLWKQCEITVVLLSLI